MYYDANLTPIYVGKGRGKRSHDHIKSAFVDYKRRCSYWLRKLHQILSNNEQYKIEIIAENLTETEAFELEIVMIAKHGRRGITDTGTLYNRHPGGSGRGAKNLDKQRQSLIELNKSRGTKVAQIGLDGILIKVWESSSEAERETGISRGGILNAAKRKDKIFKNAFWRFEGDPEFSGIFDPKSYHDSDTKRRNNHASKKLFQYSPDNKLIKEWDSMSATIRQFPKSHARAFDAAIKLKQEYLGFFWSKS